MKAEPAKLIRCTGCNHENDTDMLFCVHCGAGLVPHAERLRFKTIVLGNQCPKCQKADELNIRYCIFCGHRIKERPASAILELAELVPPEKRNPAFFNFEGALAKQRNIRLSANVGNSFSYVAGGFLAVLILILLVRQAPFLFSAGNSANQTTRLTVYTNKPFAQVTLSPDAQHFIGGIADGSGSMTFDDLTGGNYTIKISSENYRSLVANVPVEANQSTVIGYPNLIKLRHDN